MMLLLLLACKQGAADSDSPLVLVTDSEPALPEGFDEIDFASVYTAALSTLITADTRLAWAGHIGTLARAAPGCPDWYVGSPDPEVLDAEGGLSWSDTCTQDDGTTFSGAAWWSTTLTVDGDPTTAEGQSTTGSRAFAAAATIEDQDGVLFAFDGEATDALSLTDAAGYSAWTWSSELLGTIDGALAVESGGMRVETYLFASGGESQSFELRGNLYWFEDLLDGRFDSLAADLAFTDSAAPDDCALEPSGWIGVRDPEAWWYDVVFQPRYTDDAVDTGTTNDPYSACDGCGTLYVRGIEQGEVCMDFGFVWDGLLTHPTAEDYALSLRDTLDTSEGP